MSMSQDNWLWSDSNSVSFGVSNGSVLTASISTLPETPFGVSAGGQSVSTGTVVFSNSNNMTFGFVGSRTITASASETPFGLSVGTQSVSTGTLVFSNSNNFTFGMSGSSRVTASFSASNQDISLYALGNTAQNSSTVLNASVLSVSGKNAVTVGYSGSALQVDAPVVAISGAGASASNGTIVFSNSNNFSFGMAGSTVTASQGNLTGDVWDNAYAGGNAATQLTGFQYTGSHRSLFVAPMHDDLFPFNLSVSTNMIMFSISGSTATMSVAHTSKYLIGIYTRNASSLSLINSFSTAWSTGAGANNSSLEFGAKFFTVHSSQWSSEPVFVQGSRYYIAWLWSSAGGTVGQTASAIGQFKYLSAQASGTFGVSQAATSVGYAPFYGIYTVTTAALPVSISNNELNKANANAGFVPRMYMVGNNASVTAF